MSSHNLGSASPLLMKILSFGIERPVHEAEHSSPSSVGVKNAATCIAAPINAFLNPDVPSVLYLPFIVRYLFNRHDDDDDDDDNDDNKDDDDDDDKEEEEEEDNNNNNHIAG